VDTHCKRGEECRRGLCTTEFQNQVAGELSLITIGEQPSNIFGNIEGRAAAPLSPSANSPLLPFTATVVQVAGTSPATLQGQNALGRRVPNLEKTGPATLLFMAGGAALGWTRLRRRKK